MTPGASFFSNVAPPSLEVVHNVLRTKAFDRQFELYIYLPNWHLAIPISLPLSSATESHGIPDGVVPTVGAGICHEGVSVAHLSADDASILSRLNKYAVPVTRRAMTYGQLCRRHSRRHQPWPAGCSSQSVHASLTVTFVSGIVSPASQRLDMSRV